MSDPAVAIIGSGIAGTTLAWTLAQRGLEVVLLEKGPEQPYPHAPQFAAKALHQYDDPRWRLPRDLQHLVKTGGYRHDLDGERLMAVGGNASRWGAMCDRFSPADFKVQSKHRFGADWPLDYADIEPYYCRAEELLGVSGADDHPFGPPRSRPYPLPPFAHGHDTRLLAARLRTRGIVLHSAPQARTREAFDGRPACANFGTCDTCPIGARYSPQHHLGRALATGRCKLRTRVSVRRVELDRSGRARAVVLRAEGAAEDEVLPARAVVVAAGAIESVRLLLLSRQPGHADGPGNAGGHLGRHFLLHHVTAAHLDFAEPLFAGRTGAELAQSRQFVDPEDRGRHGGVLLQLPSVAALWSHAMHQRRAAPWTGGDDVVAAMLPLRSCETLFLHAETAPGPEKRVGLASVQDRFGDPFARVHYQADDFDRETYAYARGLVERVAAATGARGFEVEAAEAFGSGHHHLGGCRMSDGPGSGVTDSFGEVHGAPGLFVAGSATFPGSTALHPTLTIVALALRTADLLAERLR